MEDMRRKRTELGIIKLTKMKNPGPNGFIGAFYKYLSNIII